MSSVTLLLLLLASAPPQLVEIYETKHFFALRDGLEALTDASDPETLLLLAATAQAFNQLDVAEIRRTFCTVGTP